MITRQAEREIELLEEQLAGLADNASKKRTANDEKKRAVALQNAEVKAMECLTAELTMWRTLTIWALMLYL